MNSSAFGIKWEAERRLTDLDFADDLALIAETRDALQDMSSSLEVNAAKVGLRISSEKTKAMEIGTQVQLNQIVVNGIPVENVDRFTYLGSKISSDGQVEADINTRMGIASATIMKMNSI